MIRAVGVSNVGNTSGDTGTQVGTYIFQGGNNITLSQITGASGSNTLVISAGAGGTGGAFSAGMSTNGNTSGTTGLVGSQIVFAGGNNITLSQSVNGQSATLTISAGAGGGGFTGSYFANMAYFLNSQTLTLGQSTSYIYPFDLKEYESVGFMNFIHSVSFASTSFASTANTSYSYNQQITHNHIFYTRGVGASSFSLQSYASTSASLRMSIRLSRNTTNNISVTHALTYPVSNGTSSTSFSYAATNSSDQFSTTHMTMLTSYKFIETQFATSFEPKLIWHGFGVSTSQTTQQTANLSGGRMLLSYLVLSQPNITMASFGTTSNSSIQIRPGIGSYSIAAGATTASLEMSRISSSASHVVPMLQLMRIA